MTITTVYNVTHCVFISLTATKWLVSRTKDQLFHRASPKSCFLSKDCLFYWPMKDKHGGNHFLLIPNRFWHAHTHWFICTPSRSAEDPESTLNPRQLKSLCQHLPFHIQHWHDTAACLLVNKASTSESSTQRVTASIWTHQC